MSLRDVLIRPRNAGLLSKGQITHGDFKVIGAAVWDAIVPEETRRAAFDVFTEPSRRTNAANNPSGNSAMSSPVPRLMTRAICGKRQLPIRETRSSTSMRQPSYMCLEQASLRQAESCLVRTETTQSWTVRRFM